MTDIVEQLRLEAGRACNLLHCAMVGACNCLTKTHEARWHDEECFYRKLSEQCDRLEAAIDAAMKG